MKKPESVFNAEALLTSVKEARNRSTSPKLVREVAAGNPEAYVMAAGLIGEHLRWFRATPEGKRRAALGENVESFYVETVFGEYGSELKNWAAESENIEKSLVDFLEDKKKDLIEKMDQYREQLQSMPGFARHLEIALDKYMESREGDGRVKATLDQHKKAILEVMVEEKSPSVLPNRQHFYRGSDYVIAYMKKHNAKGAKMTAGDFEKEYRMSRDSWQGVLEALSAKRTYDRRG